VLIAGSGASGLATAITAAAMGLKVLVVEKEALFGGTTCYSAGVMWIPGSRQAQAAGLRDDPQTALAYLVGEGQGHTDAAKAGVYVERAAKTLAWFEDNTHVSYHLSPLWPDYHQGVAGASPGGRSLGANAFDARRLGARWQQLRPPLATTTLFGGMMVAREDLMYFYSFMKSWRSVRVVVQRGLRYLLDRLSGHPRSTRLSNGNALAAMLAQSAFERGVDLWLKSPVKELLFDAGRVVGAKVQTADGLRTVRARGGVVLAGGGFPADDTLRKRYYAHVAAGQNHQTAAPPGNTGDSFRMGTQAGVAVVDDPCHPAAWTPVSMVPQADGTLVPFPHYNDRGKAGYIAVDRRGRRFISESLSYHDFVPAMIKACQGDAEVSSWLICDSHAIRDYGLGRAPPRPMGVQPFVRSGYLKKASSLADLARQCGIDPAGLAQTVERLNAGADQGVDAEFHKGADIYERFNGSRGHTPNPCVGPVRHAPFYAVKLVPGDIGTFIGLKADTHARALDATGQAIEGLYVVGNDAASFMGGTYPGAGITLGPALVFGHIAAQHIGQRLGAPAVGAK
jgi:succinate dehydrogenase/fumarate reductase flavoprotein subunit